MQPPSCPLVSIQFFVLLAGQVAYYVVRLGPFAGKLSSTVVVTHVLCGFIFF